MTTRTDNSAPKSNLRDVSFAECKPNVNRDQFSFLRPAAELPELSETAVNSILKAEIEKDLAAWMGQLNATGNKSEAKETLLRCFLNKTPALDLSNLRLNCLPKCMRHFGHVKFLDLSCNFLTDIDLQRFGMLENLIIFNNRLSSVELQHLDTAKLRSLNLDSNEISKINLSGFARLQELRISANKLTSVDLKDLVSLQTLDLGSNQLQFVDLTGLSSLSHIWLERNLIVEFKLENVETVQELRLYGNLLRNFSLKNLRRLETVYLEGNELVSIELTNLPNLKKLFLNQNADLAEIPSELNSCLHLHVIETDSTKIPHDKVREIFSKLKAGNAK